MKKEIIKSVENNIDGLYENLTYKELNWRIEKTFRNMAENFIELGFWLKQVRKDEKFKEDGYNDIWEYAKDKYGISRSKCSRYMDINDKFSENGNSPTLAEEYRNYGKSQLQEMLYLELLQDKLEKEKKTLVLMQEEFTDKDRRVRLQKLVVGALAAYICDLDKILNPLQEPVQPDLPVLKNNEQRKAWLCSYKDWGLWYEDENIGCKYFKYDFKNGARLIAEVYLVPKTRYCDEREVSYLHLVGGPEPPKDKTGYYGKWQRHEKYSRYPSNETELVEFLKYVQREK